jgi:hypothetical protein
LRKNNNFKRNLSISILLLIILLICLMQCKSCNNTVEDPEEIVYAIEGQTADGFEDGTYCADVDYYNPNTGTKNRYTLQVEVQKNEVVKILFGNGGWLDSEHMKPQNVGQKGECIISTDRNYEYTIKIKGKDCGYSDNINPETDVDFPRYTFAECTQMLGMSQEEIDKCLSNLYSEGDILSENGLNAVSNYINVLRYNNELIQKENIRYNNEVNKLNYLYSEGFITYIDKSKYSRQTVIIIKRGVDYKLEVSGNTKCTMGTAKFDEKNYDWQLVYVKEHPDIEKYSGYYMRIIK